MIIFKRCENRSNWSGLHQHGGVVSSSLDQYHRRAYFGVSNHLVLCGLGSHPSEFEITYWVHVMEDCKPHLNLDFQWATRRRHQVFNLKSRVYD